MKLIRFAAIIVTSSSMTFALLPPGHSINIYGALSIPLGEFSDTKGFDSSGFAKTGPAFGIQYGFEPFSHQLAFIMDLSLAFYGFDHEEISDLVPFNIVDTTIGGRYVSAPFLFGTRLEMLIAEQIIHATLLGGFNILWQEDIEGRTPAGTITYSRTMKFDDPSTTFCWGIGLGTLIIDRISLGIRFMLMGTAEYEYNRNIFLAGGEIKQIRSFRASVFQIYSGVQF